MSPPAPAFGRVDEATGRLAVVLDILIVALPVWIVGVVLAGRFDRAWIAEHHVAEPLLALAVLIPLRVGDRRAGAAGRLVRRRDPAPGDVGRALAAAEPTSRRRDADPLSDADS